VGPPVIRLAIGRGRLAVAVFALGLVAGAAWTVRGWRADAAVAQLQAQHAATVAVAAQQLADTVALYRQREQQIQEKVDVIAAQAIAIAQERQQERTAARRTADGLRDAVHAVAAQCSGAPADPGAAGAGPAASAPGDLLAYVHRRLDEAAAGIAAHADDAADAGRSCERAYDAVRQ